jgi:hypothetical protein
MLRDLLTQKFAYKFSLLILDAPEHVDSEKPNRQIEIGKNWQKWKFSTFLKSLFFYWIRSKTVCGVFHYLQNVKIAEKSFKISQFLPILANFSHMLWIKITFWKKLVEGVSKISKEKFVGELLG